MQSSVAPTQQEQVHNGGKSQKFYTLMGIAGHEIIKWIIIGGILLIGISLSGIYNVYRAGFMGEVYLDDNTLLEALSAQLHGSMIFAFFFIFSCCLFEIVKDFTTEFKGK